MKDKGLGSVDAFGLDEFGQPAGLNPIWGAVAGTGLGTLGAIATRQFTSWGRHSELVGFGLGALASGAMLAFPGTRAAGWTGLASTFLNNGLRQLEVMFFAASAAEAAANAAINGVVIEPTHEVNGLGLATIEPTHEVNGLGAGDMPQLVGANLRSASEHVQLVGGPALAQFAGHWGATVIPS